MSTDFKILKPTGATITGGRQEIIASPRTAVTIWRTSPLNPPAPRHKTELSRGEAGFWQYHQTGCFFPLTMQQQEGRAVHFFIYYQFSPCWRFLVEPKA